MEVARIGVTQDLEARTEAVENLSSTLGLNAVGEEILARNMRDEDAVAATRGLGSSKRLESLQELKDYVQELRASAQQENAAWNQRDARASYTPVQCLVHSLLGVVSQEMASNYRQSLESQICASERDRVVNAVSASTAMMEQAVHKTSKQYFAAREKLTKKRNDLFQLQGQLMGYHASMLDCDAELDQLKKEIETAYQGADVKAISSLSQRQAQVDDDRGVFEMQIDRLKDQADGLDMEINDCAEQAIYLQNLRQVTTTVLRDLRGKKTRLVSRAEKYDQIISPDQLLGVVGLLEETDSVVSALGEANKSFMELAKNAPRLQRLQVENNDVLGTLAGQMRRDSSTQYTHTMKMIDRHRQMYIK
jgi:uncharacterized coiled-coil DUF342 family protein